NLGVMYTKGKGVQKDYVKAYSWLYAAAKSNEPHMIDAIRKVRNKLNESELEEATRVGDSYC
ncbi:MAG: SEL1-like repeat protein, partial [Gammaproteobacteria bacterium]